MCSATLFHVLRKQNISLYAFVSTKAVLVKKKGRGIFAILRPFPVGSCFIFPYCFIAATPKGVARCRRISAGGSRKARRCPRLPPARERRSLCAGQSDTARLWRPVRIGQLPRPAKKAPLAGAFFAGWGSWIRTSECRSQSPVPYRLAIAQCCFSAGWIMRFELMTSRATIWRANQLRYTHHTEMSGTHISNVLEGIRTPDPRLRRPLLYPAELRTHIF